MSSRAPLVHAITNLVTMDWVARGLLAAGARPFMALDPSEAGTAAEHADALLLNMGTWSPDTHAAMLAAGAVANRRGVPIVFDPVGAGGLPSRTDLARSLLTDLRITVVKGNAGEIAALAGEHGGVSGVDSQVLPRLDLAQRVALAYGVTVVITGARDLVTDGHESLEVRAGHPMMAKVPGTGCLGGALIAAALAGTELGPSPVSLVAQALLRIGYVGEVAAMRATGPGSFITHYLDGLSQVDQLPENRIALPLADRLSLYVIVSGKTPLTTIDAILAAGVKAVQFREKELPLPAQLLIARQIQERCRAQGALFIVNDRVDLALAIDADGVHVGQEDLPVATARALLGASAIVGATCETVAEAQIAMAQGADYLGTGPVYQTYSKSDAGKPHGPAIVARIVSVSTIPVVGIGGIAVGTAAPVIDAGACGVSVIGAITQAPDPGAAAKLLLTEVYQAKRGRLG
jgi:hydroxyethylthiazole kinase